MDWGDWTAVCALGLSVFNTVANYRKGVPHVALESRVEKMPDGHKRLVVKLINTGSVPVVVEQLSVYVSGNPGSLTEMPFRTEDRDDVWKDKKLLPSEKMEAFGVVGPGNVLNQPHMRFAEGLVLKLSGRKPVRYPQQALIDEATKARLEAKVGSVS